ncbi:hypothetical protein ACFY1P_20180 [Streptomyces sp. NPDC001407]|uniref:hypothetical protein n=1 Tax=Streptomyces sp. NPDC001407 TaxID=3364573 RepID=UPI00369EB9C6
MGPSMISGESKTSRLRTRYTAEPKAAALHYFRQSGLRFGLVPDAEDFRQRLLEALLLRTLARRHPALAQLSEPGSVWGLAGASPAPDGLVLWPAPGQVPGLLARWLPTRTPDGLIGGVPGLRAAPLPSRSHYTLSLALAGHAARVELRAEPADVREAARLAAETGLTVLWEADAASRAEDEALGGALADLNGAEAALWSGALRRLGLARNSYAAWRHRAPLESELEGPNPERIAPRDSGPGAGLRGVVAVLPGDGKGGQGCTAAAYLLAAAAAAGGARVGLMATAYHARLLRLLGRDDSAPFTGWRDVSRPLPPGSHLKAALVAEGDDAAAEQLAAARADFDLVVLDVGSGRQPRLAGQADAVLALVVDRVPWYSHEVLDDRSARAQIWSHVSEQRLRGPEPGLPGFLDETFQYYVEWRAGREGIPVPQDEDEDESGTGLTADAAEADATGPHSEEDDYGVWTEPYDPHDPAGIEMFWSRPAESHLHPDLHDVLPAEDDAPYLDTWRADFLSILTPEGQHRHPEQWPHILAHWSERNRSRNLERLPAGAPTADERLAACAQQAIERWGEQTWQRESAAWRAASPEERAEVCRAERDRVWTVKHPRPAQDVAEELRAIAPMVPSGRPVVLAVTRVRQDIDRHLMDEVSQVLQGQGIAGLTVIPHSEILQQRFGVPEAGVLPTHVLSIGRRLAAAVRPALRPRP